MDGCEISSPPCVSTEVERALQLGIKSGLTAFVEFALDRRALELDEELEEELEEELDEEDEG